VLSITSTEWSIQNEPEGLRELRHRVYFAKDIKGYLEEWQGQLTFIGEDYTFLRNQLLSGACSVIPITLDDGCRRSYNANLFLNEAEWRPDICQVSVNVIDAGYLTLIANNKDIKAYLNVGRSKNDVDISAYTTVQTNCEFSEYQTGVDSPTSADREGVRVYDAFKFLIAFMSDGLMDFESTYFATESDPATPSLNRNPTLFDPSEITTGGGSAYPYISFDDLLTDINRLYNVEFSVDVQGNGRPLLRIETPEYFRQNSSSFVAENAAEVTQVAELESYYQKIIMGSAKVQSDHDYYDPIQLFSWDREDYHLGGTCNSEAILDLRLQTLISDTNSIQDALPVTAGGTASTENEGAVAIVLMDGDNVTITNDNPVNPSFQYYNALIKNDEVLNRFYGAIPNSIFLFLGEGINDAEHQVQTLQSPSLSLIANPVLTFINTFADFVDFPVEISDPNNNMAVDNTAFDFLGLTNTQCTSYDAPVGGVYNITVKISQNNTDFANQSGAFYLVTYPAGSTTFEQVIPFGRNFGIESDRIPILQGLTYSESGDVYIENGLSVCEGSATMFLDSGDRLVVVCAFEFNTTPTTGYQPTCQFIVNDTLTIERTFDPQTNYLINTTFDYPITPQEWQSFLDDRYGEITVTHQNGMIKGFLREATRNFEDGITEWKIRSTFGDS